MAQRRLLAVIGLGLGLMQLPAAGEAFLVKAGQPRADIVTAPSPARGAKFAASELQDGLFKITGARLPIVTEPGVDVPVHLYVGRSTHTDQLKIGDEDLKYGAFRLVSGENFLVLLGMDRDFTLGKKYVREKDGRPFYFEEWDSLTGATWAGGYPPHSTDYNAPLQMWACDERGSLNAVHEFLRGLGARWFFPGELGEVMPTLPDVALPKVERTVRPDFQHRNFYIYYQDFMRATKDYALWQLRLGLNVNDGFGGGHGLVDVYCRDKSHPEYFALFNGARATTEPWGQGTPCLSSEGLFESAVKYARTVSKIYPDMPVISLMPGDGYVKLCECELCKGKGTPERGAQGTLSDYVWGFVNRAAVELYQTNPDRKVSCGAYTAYQLPPEKIAQLSPNVVVSLCRWRTWLLDPEKRQQFAMLTQAWLDKLPSKDVYIYDYYLEARPNTLWAGLPAYYPHLISDDLRFLKGKSKGEFIEVYSNWLDDGHTGNALAASHLNLYITSRLYWDASQDVDALLEDYYTKFYGPAAGEMKAFIAYGEANWRAAAKEVQVMDHMLELRKAARGPATGTGYEQRGEFLTQLQAADKTPLIERFYELLGTARKAAGDTVYGRRVELLLQYMDFVLVKHAKSTEKLVIAMPIKGAVALDAPEWVHAMPAILGGRPLGRLPLGSLPRVYAPVKHQTTFQVLYDAANAYLRVECELPAGATTFAAFDKTGATGKQEAVEICIAPLGKKEAYFRFVLGPRSDSKAAEAKGRTAVDPLTGEEDSSVDDGDWAYTCRLEPDKNRWVGLLTIPFKTLGVLPPGVGTPWRLNVGRTQVTGEGQPECSLWSGTPATKGVTDRSGFGEIAF